ncbi:hypothetical protein [Deinococcus yavapaiensis]|uniref:YD repeat-containing protein n=1 Tax=Deinococcus yavapaiensis KR-236 TaxID=694435 RepID=A0A318S640_9DEIO|nr:hypothetical protein [Deinococcus yavapaiensis]PYE49483.1 YD repeat-containing protein [Deinococcus yavapaiensis KR-236]
MRILLTVILLAVATSASAALPGCLQPRDQDILQDAKAIASVQDSSIDYRGVDGPVTTTLYANGNVTRFSWRYSSTDADHEFDTYTYNTQGQLISIETRSDKKHHVRTYTFDAQGRMTSEKLEVFKSDFLVPELGVIEHLVCTYPQENVVQEDDLLGPDAVRAVGEFDTRGQLIRYTTYRATRGQPLKLESVQTFEYKNGLRSQYKKTTYNDDGSVYSTSVGLYNEKGWPVSVETKDGFSAKSSLFTLEYTKVDAHGNWMTRIGKLNGKDPDMYSRVITYNK